MADPPPPGNVVPIDTRTQRERALDEAQALLDRCMEQDLSRLPDDYEPDIDGFSTLDIHLKCKHPEDVCSHCGEWMEFACDWPVRGGTCDSRLCPKHATVIGDNLHLCPVHATIHATQCARKSPTMKTIPMRPEAPR